MLRQRCFLGPLGLALLALSFVLGIGSFASTAQAPSDKTPPPAANEIANGETVARSEDGAFVVRLLSPRGPYLFGHQRIEVAVEVPPGDRVKTIDFFVDGRLRRTATGAPFALEADFGDEIERHTLLILGQTLGGRAARLSGSPGPRASRPGSR